MEEITRGSGDAFADLGFPDAYQRQTKVKLAQEINRILEEPSPEADRYRRPPRHQSAEGIGADEFQARWALG